MSDVIVDTSAERFCQTCGYNLRGLASDRCPECGEKFDPTQAAGARIPWLQRSAIGTWRAYWRTVGMAMFHPLKMAREVWDAPRVDPAAGLRFRSILIVQAVVSVMLVVAALSFGTRPMRPVDHFKLLAFLET